MGNAGYKTYLQSAFLICAIVLAISGSGMSVAIKTLGVQLEKEFLALRKPLDVLDESELAPYRLVSKQAIASKDVIKALGTEDYIEWVLEDCDVPADSPVRSCSLFITYYGKADKRVTHIADECYTGVGYQRLGNGESVTFEVVKDGRREKLPGRYVVFSREQSERWWGDIKFPVLYLFYVNGQYAGSRDESRFVINKALFRKHCYYSKVEWKFSSAGFGRPVFPNKEQAIAASEKLLSVILPVLEKDFWPEEATAKSE